MKEDGRPGATRIEEGVMLIRPTPLGLGPVLGASQYQSITVNEQDIGEALGGKKDKGFLAGMFAPPVYEGGSAEAAEGPQKPVSPPKAVPIAKAVVPAGIIPKAAVPAGIIPKAVAPVVAEDVPVVKAAAAVPPSTPEKKTSEWI
jgi:hypothetical protein